jgi:hypothetical protein
MEGAFKKGWGTFLEAISVYFTIVEEAPLKEAVSIEKGVGGIFSVKNLFQ